MKHPSYKNAIDYIAENDDPTVRDVDAMSGQISIQLVSELFGLDSHRVALDVVKYESIIVYETRSLTPIVF